MAGRTITTAAAGWASPAVVRREVRTAAQDTHRGSLHGPIGVASEAGSLCEQSREGGGCNERESSEEKTSGSVQRNRTCDAASRCRAGVDVTRLKTQEKNSRMPECRNGQQ